jgi:predicted ferric reductase
LASAAIAFGRLTGLLAGGAVLLQFSLIGRAPWIERTFGLDKLVRLHHINGQLAGIFLLLHPVLLTLGYASLAGVSLLSQLADFLFNYQYVLWAGIGWLLFLIVIPSSIAIVRRRLRYESWYFVHLLVYLAVFLSLWHPLFVGTDLIASRVFYLYWIALYTAVFASHVVFRWVHPLVRNYRHRFVVTDVKRENRSAVSVYITGRQLDRFPIEPGQFMIFRFLTAGRWWQAHPFSLSMLPDGKRLRITVRELGDFTNRVSDIPVGTKVFIDGPYGVFTEWVSISPKVLFIAGGIGITPIRSLMEHFLKKGKEAVLLYANKTKADSVFDQELAMLTQAYSGRVVDVLSDDPAFPGEKGFIDTEKLKRLVPDVTSRDVYLCGPPPMMKALKESLRALGVPSSQIHWERFAL